MRRFLKIILMLLVGPTVLPAQQEIPPLEIAHLTGNFYVYTTYNFYDGQAVPSNSLYVLTDSGVVLIDTPWDSTQFQPVLDSIEARHGKKVVLCISTHFHADRTAGLEYYRAKGIRTYSSKLTLDWCKKEGEKQPEFTFSKDTVFQVGGLRLETYYPGEGHAPDNIVVWFGQAKLLYGGCFVKSVESSGLGNLSHANPAAWAKSVQKVRKKYRKARYIIPGHFGWQGDGLRHTAKLLRKHLKI